MSEPNRALGLHFFTMQDKLRGGPDPSLCAPGYTARINGNSVDLDGHTQFAAAFYAAFPDLNHIIEDTVADDDKVAVRVRLEGTHRGEFMGVPPTGKHVTLEFIAMLQIKDGKVVELRAVDNGLMDQLKPE
jgi:predicted ester cyclase